MAYFHRSKSNYRFTIGEYILQKVLDTSPITTAGFCCHKISLAKVGNSRDMCPKQPKKVSHYVKILEKNCLKIKFFKKFCISDFAKMG